MYTNYVMTKTAEEDAMGESLQQTQELTHASSFENICLMHTFDVDRHAIIQKKTKYLEKNDAFILYVDV